eukprot:TRINITY_DN19431_c0_g2_i1.p2 TRINITY_DN19431_c0_g2~~TRINITY_DN19431_c0_g2_i1.p2  ORF type:complete len:182 (-),score=62.32 TRINITY_DN19431_c0_g2_i1:999-1544(-)
MDAEVDSLKEELSKVEAIAENLLLAKRELVDFDRQRNGNREALTALRKAVKKAEEEFGRPLIKEVPSPLQRPDGRPGSSWPHCPTCGDSASSFPVWLAFPGVQSFVRVPVSVAQQQIERAQVQVEGSLNSRRSAVKLRTLELEERGALAGSGVGPQLLKAMVNLKDDGKQQQKKAQAWGRE